ncbi:MAG: 4-(cytidine 5'-diphospho)-2-C-methyl-D-erythritol kinase [Nitrospirae bacterium]|nr:4-(cytidine 5'-diphospho)-2-C-methyl-D-erythritol kinase [Nitrospirota bacterium]
MLTLTAPAKINWFLEVSGKREDGYHEILSLMQCITLGDSIGFADSDEIEVVTDALIPSESNLAYRAAKLLKELSGVRKGVVITLGKQIPTAAGLGGGSSDAACTLLGLNRLWGLNMTREELAGIGGMLGSDVPFFFYGPAAVVRGRGESVSPVALDRSCPIVVVKPQMEISSAWAYGELDKESSGGRVLTKNDNNITLFCQALERGDFPFLSSLKRNDLEPLVVRRHPVIGEIEKDLLKHGALFSCMSGSGSAVFGVFDSEESAARSAESMPSHWSRVVRTIARSG